MAYVNTENVKMAPAIEEYHILDIERWESCPYFKWQHTNVNKKNFSSGQKQTQKKLNVDIDTETLILLFIFVISHVARNFEFGNYLVSMWCTIKLSGNNASTFGI